MELTEQASEFDARPIAPKPLLEGPLAALLVSELKVNVRGSRFLSAEWQVLIRRGAFARSVRFLG
jgi:hypothetical protein